MTPLHPEDIILKHLITEKVSSASEKDNRYGFVVRLKANKNQIRQAVSKLYNVNVLNVKTCITPGRPKRVGRLVKKTASVKKAIVQIEEGQKIETLKGV